MKMLYLASKFPPPLEGGSWVYLYNIISHLPPSEVMVYTNARPNQGEFDAAQVFRILRSHCRVRDFGKFGKLRMWSEWFVTLVYLLRREKIDILHIGDLFPAGAIAWVVARLFNKPYVIYTYAEELSQQLRRTDRVWGRLKGWIFSRLIQDADGLISISDYTSALLETFGADRQKIRKILPTAVSPKPVAPEELEVIRAKYGLTSGQRVILSVARLIKRKGQDYLIRSMPQVLEAFPNTVLIIVGRGMYEDKLRQIAVEVNVLDKTVFAGLKTDLAPFYGMCDVFALPFRELDDGDTEGFGIVFIEANAHGKPVVGGQAGGVRDAILDGETGFIVDGKRPDQIAAALIGLLGNPELARRLGETGRQRVLSELSPERGAAQVMAFSRSILEKRSLA